VQALERRREAGVGDQHEAVVVAAKQHMGEQGELEPFPGRDQALGGSAGLTAGEPLSALSRDSFVAFCR